MPLWSVMLSGVGSARPTDLHAIAARGLADGAARMNAAAAKVTRDADVAAIVDLGTAGVQVEVAAKVSRIADDMMGTLIDTFA